MNIRSVIVPRIICIFVLSLFTFASLPEADASPGSRREKRSVQSTRSERREVRSPSRSTERRRVVSPRYTPRGHETGRLPRGYRRVWHRSEPYYYSYGIFYRPYRSGFVVVEPPPGIVVFSLPVGYQSIWVDDTRFYLYGGVFYRRVPSGYMVVEAPVEVVIEDTPVIVQPPDNDTGMVTVTAALLNVRSGPGLDYPVLHQIHKGYVLEVHGRTTGWLYVRLPNEEFGWVMNIYTKRIEPPGSG